MLNNKNLFAMLLLAITIGSCKKDPANNKPEPTRYLEESFTQVDISTTTYSTVYNLSMDIYQPAGDTKTDRPLVIFAHGGAFVSGSKQNPYAVDLAQSLARRGYVVANINYRLAGNIFDMIDSIKAIEIVMKSLGDGRAAVRYFRKSVVEQNNPYGIDTSRIFFGGNSAGAVLAAHLAYLRSESELPNHMKPIVQQNGGIDGNSGNPGYSAEVKAIFALAGGINQTSWINADEAPALFAHGTADDVVPYDCNYVFYGFYTATPVITLCGSLPMHQRAQAIGLQSKLLAYPGKHVPWVDAAEKPNALFREMEKEIFNFLFSHL